MPRDLIQRVRNSPTISPPPSKNFEVREKLPDLCPFLNKVFNPAEGEITRSARPLEVPRAAPSASPARSKQTH